MTLPKGFEFDPMAVDDMLSMLSGLAQKNSDYEGPPTKLAWHTRLSDSWLDKLIKFHFYVSKIRVNADEYSVKGQQ